MPSKATGRQELLSVVRTEGGDLTVLVRGQPRRRLRDIDDPRLGQDTIEAIQAILAFAEGWIPFIQKWTAETSADTHVQSIADRKPYREPPRRDVSSHPSRPPSSLSRSTVPRSDSMLEPLPLIDEINDLVQKRLRENPDLADHLITLTTAIDGSLRIYVDQQAFQTINDVTDPRVRALIQGAIHEWEEH